MGYPEVLFLPENGSRWSKRIILILNCVFWACRMYVQLISYELFESVDRFNMAANFQDGRHRQSCNTILPQNDSRQFKWWFGVICDMFQHGESKFDDAHAIWVFRSFQYGRQLSRWPPWVILKILFLPYIARCSEIMISLIIRMCWIWTICN